MRFLVDLYRYLVIALCAVFVVALIYGTMLLLDGSIAAGGEYNNFVIGASIALAIFFIIAIATTAILLSMHDSLCSVADSLRALAERKEGQGE